MFCMLQLKRLFLWFLLPTALIVGCVRTKRAVVQRYVQLHRSHDIDGLLALHTSDAEFLIPGQHPIRGKEALRHLFEWDSVLGSELAMTGLSIAGDTILVDTVIERNRFFRALGLTEVRYQPGTRFVLRNGQIAGTYPAALSEESLKSGIEEYQHLFQWLSANRPDAYSRLLPGGLFRYNASNARLWLQVLAEWKQSKR